RGETSIRPKRSESDTRNPFRLATAAVWTKRPPEASDREPRRRATLRRISERLRAVSGRQRTEAGLGAHSAAIDNALLLSIRNHPQEPPMNRDFHPSSIILR